MMLAMRYAPAALLCLSALDRMLTMMRGELTKAQKALASFESEYQ